MTKELRIILVEDDPAQAKLFNLVLKKRHAHVRLEHFETAEEVLQFIKESTDFSTFNNIVLSDLNLPVGTGIDLYKEICKTERRQELRFLLYTQVTNSTILQQAYDAGVTSVLTKSDSFEEFESLVSTIVAKSSINIS